MNAPTVSAPTATGIADFIAPPLEFAAAELTVLPEATPLPAEVPFDFFFVHTLWPVEVNESLIRLASPMPPPLAALDALRQRLQRRVVVLPAARATIERLLARRAAEEDEGRSAQTALPEASPLDLDAEQDLNALKALAEDAPVVKLAQELLNAAIDARASDLHLEIFQEQFRVRQRVDGVLLDQPSPPRRFYLPLISHLKLRAQMNIAERRLPQDGRIKMSRGGRDIDMRVSTVPTVHGESMVLRLLDQGAAGMIGISDLGLDAANAALLRSAITLPHGMILVTGPTGSGKTTTLYAVLAALNHPGNKIITVEDPVEYQIGGVNQIPVKPAIGLTFANALRSIVRQDPDVLMVGEIRDRETAEIAIQSALTGHLVFSTLHTNDAAGAPHRLLDMGVEPYLIASSVVLIVAQRLVRNLCPQCKRPHAASSADRLFLAQHGLNVGGETIYGAVGCPACAGTGYQGRSGIFEFLPVSDEIKEAVLRKEPASVLRRIAQQAGHGTLYADGLRKVLSGQTTLEELARVARFDAASDAVPMSG